VDPQRFIPGNAASAPPVRLAVGLVGGTKNFSFSNSTTLSSYMAAVHTEKTSDAFDMTTGKLAQ
jgi:nanoRNase/pAp phosphatase (c-di-AMP/oligoRNAs hydrolase)